MGAEDEALSAKAAAQRSKAGSNWPALREGWQASESSFLSLPFLLPFLGSFISFSASSLPSFLSFFLPFYFPSSDLDLCQNIKCERSQGLPWRSSG